MGQKRSGGAAAIFLAMTILLGGMSTAGAIVHAEEAGQQPENIVEGPPEGPAAVELPVDFSEDVEIREQKPQPVTDFSKDVPEAGNSKVQGRLSPDSAAAISLPEVATYQYIDGQVSDVLLQTGDQKYLLLDGINPGIFIQAQLIQPQSPDIDYDLYITDIEGNVLAYSETYTNINGADGTLSECAGYITTGSEAADYYIYVISSNGGSVNEPFVLQYSVSNVIDPNEPDDNPMDALAFTLRTDGAYIDTKSIVSPVDTDWYKINIPDRRIYDELNISLETTGNGCEAEVYQNKMTDVYQMAKIAGGGTDLTVGVTEGTYYIRVRKAGGSEFREENIQPYKLTITPRLRPDTITIEELEGNEGINTYIPYPGYKDPMFRTRGWIKVTGEVKAKDPVTGIIYPVANQSVTALYKNPYWEANHTPAFAEASAEGVTDNSGKYTIRLDLPVAMGKQTYNAGLSTQYFDVCKFRVYPTDKSDLVEERDIVNFKYSLYN